MSETDTWKCLNCGVEQEVERPRRPIFCENPNCRNKDKNLFVPQGGPHTFFEGKNFIPLKMAEAILTDHRFATMQDTEEVYHYEEGVYLPKGESVIRSEVRKRLGDMAKANLTYETVRQIVETTYAKREDFDNPGDVLAVENGMLDVLTGELTSHTPDRLTLVKLPVKYDPSADCPLIKKFLSEILAPDYIPLIQELVGYCLYRRYIFAKAVMLLGPGENGKSTLLKLIVALLGVENVASPSLQALLYDKFASALLFGKLANIHADLPNKELKAAGTFKMLTGQDPIYAQRKHKDQFTFYNHAKLLYSANELPPTSDTTTAFWRRWIVVDFKVAFPEGDPRCDPNLISKITTPEELSGFLNFARDGLIRLLEKHKFSPSKSRDDIQVQWMEQTDSLRAFVSVAIVFEEGVYITKDDFYAAYQKFCSTREIEAVTKSAVGHRFPAIFPQTGEVHPSDEKGKQARAWNNIKFTDITDITDISPSHGSELENIHRERVEKNTVITAFSGMGCGEKPPSGASGDSCSKCGEPAVAWNKKGEPFCNKCIVDSKEDI